jgi:hypothetical protein
MHIAKDAGPELSADHMALAARMDLIHFMG